MRRLAKYKMSRSNELSSMIIDNIDTFEQLLIQFIWAVYPCGISFWLHIESVTAGRMFVIWHLLILEISVTGALACGECKDLMVPSYDGFVIQNPSWFMFTEDRVSCLWECYRQPRCRSFQYDYTSGECRGYDEYLANGQSYAGYNSTNDITTVKLCPGRILY